MVTDGDQPLSPAGTGQVYAKPFETFESHDLAQPPAKERYLWSQVTKSLFARCKEDTISECCKTLPNVQAPWSIPCSIFPSYSYLRLAAK